MMKKALMLSEKTDLFKDVYKSETKAKISSFANLEDKVYSSSDLSEIDTSEVSFIFSTWGMPTFSQDYINKKFPKLEAVFYAAGTVQKFARSFLSNNVKVFSAWQANAIPVAEFTLAQIILANKGYYQALNKTKIQNFSSAKKYCTNLSGNFNTKIGILGAGMIGKYLINLLKPFSFEIFVFDPFMSQEIAKELSVKLCDLDYIFKNCDIISNHLANNENTLRMLNYQHFSEMKDYATFINTGRGAQVVECDLVRAFTENPTKTALLDVTKPEPPTENHKFYFMDNVFLSPHIAGSMNNEVARMGEFMACEFERYMKNEKLLYEVNLKMLETMA